ncbi:uncharacterized protein LOC121786718 [Salvia splendens]|uniref:uncharacterized protein LOC121786718 n=1 Tax=Salvia splendens TaxID=180675 RepID=UPI001C26B683|nr:uncharacterized protein LOC121786718 [Salvia splendens]
MIWKRLIRVRAQAQPHIRWVVGQGKIYFWDDIWLGESALRDLAHDDRGCPNALVGDFIREGIWDESKIRMLHSRAGLPQRTIEQILGTPIVDGGPDIPRWDLSRFGDFSLTTTWETIPTQLPIVRGLDDIWKAGLTSSISIIIWQLLSKLQWRKMELASKCQCCPQRPGIESLQHLSIQGAGAISVWREFDDWFEGSSPQMRINETIPYRLGVWAWRTQQSRILSHAMSYLIMWFLWVKCNRSRHQMTQFKPFNVVWQVQTYIRNNMAVGNTKSKHWKGVRLKMNIPSEAETRLPRPLAMPVKWHPPDRRTIKINTDGAYSEATGKAGGGGLIRNSLGRLILEFSAPLDAQSSLEAELKAAQLGLTLAQEFKQPMWLELDSEQVIKLISGTGWGSAHLRQEVARLRVLKRQSSDLYPKQYGRWKYQVETLEGCEA